MNCDEWGALCRDTKLEETRCRMCGKATGYYANPGPGTFHCMLGEIMPRQLLGECILPNLRRLTTEIVIGQWTNWPPIQLEIITKDERQGLPCDVKYQIHDGHHRYYAAYLVGLPSISAMIAD